MEIAGIPKDDVSRAIAMLDENGHAIVIQQRYNWYILVGPNGWGLCMCGNRPALNAVPRFW